MTWLRTRVLLWLGLSAAAHEIQQSGETILAHHARIVELEKRHAELLAMVLDMETKEKEPAPKTVEDPEVAGSWSRTRRRAESAA